MLLIFLVGCNLKKDGTEKSQGANPATKKLQFYPDDVYVDGIDDHPRKTLYFILDGLF